MSDISTPVGETDYISTLHDTILCHILSFLPTKSAVKTCVFSKRWKKVWKQVSVLDFTEIPENYHPLCNDAKILYNNFVNKILVENNAFYLERFCYEFSYDDECDYYESWMEAAKKREYYEIDLNFTLGGSQSYKFMEMIYGKGVKILKITGLRVNGTPESFQLPFLEIVHLVRVEFNGSEYMKRFTSNCPTLKKFIIKECTGFDEMLLVESLTLKSLEICDIASHAWGRSLIISIKAPILQYLKIDDEITYYMVDSLALLTEANLNLKDNFPVMISEYGSNYDAYQNINDLISKASKVKSLRLKTSGFFLNGRDLPTFENLIHLEVKAESCTYELLRKTPKLKSLIFEEVEWIDSSFNYVAEEGCLANLRHLTIFLNNERQVHLVSCVLKAATNLEEMIINLCCPVISETIIRRELSVILTPSVSLKIQDKTVCFYCPKISERRTQQFPIILTPSSFSRIKVIFTKSRTDP